MIVIAFMAVTSSGASEMVAVSSLFTFDVYRRYIHPKVHPCCSTAPRRFLQSCTSGYPTVLNPSCIPHFPALSQHTCTCAASALVTLLSQPCCPDNRLTATG